MAQPQTARKGARIAPVSELSVFCKVKPGREQAIREVFNPSPEEHAATVKAVKDVGTLHNARYVLFDDGTRLLIATTFDGDWDVYIDDFAASYVLDAWDKFLIHCEGYPDEGKASLTVDEIKEALRVQAAVQESLDNPDAGEALQHPALKPLREVAAD